MKSQIIERLSLYLEPVTVRQLAKITGLPNLAVLLAVIHLRQQGQVEVLGGNTLSGVRAVRLVPQARSRAQAFDRPTVTPGQRNIAGVVLWMAGALLAFSATGVAVRLLSASFAVFEILSFRSLAGLLILLTLSGWRPHLRPQLKPSNLPLHAGRNLIQFAGTYAWTYGLTLLPLATVFALEFTTPLWVGLLAVPLLGEAITRARIGALLLGFMGVLIIVRPGLETLQPAALIVLGSALAFALTSIATKKLTATQSTFTILVWMNLMQLPLNLSGALIGAEQGFWVKINGSHVLPLIGVCLGGLLSQFCLTNAYRHGDASLVIPLDFLRIPLIALVGWQLFGEAIDPLLLLGSVFIITGILWNLYAERSRTKA